MLMATLQVKRVPDELYDKAKMRASAEGISLSEYVLRMLQRDLALPSVREWLDEVRSHPIHLSDDVDLHEVLDEAKAEIEGR